MKKKMTYLEWDKQTYKLEEIKRCDNKERKIEFIYYLGGIMGWENNNIIKELKKIGEDNWNKETNYLKNNVKLKSLSNEMLNMILQNVNHCLAYFYLSNYEIS